MSAIIHFLWEEFMEIQAETASVEEAIITAKLDTGADVNLISKKTIV